MRKCIAVCMPAIAILSLFSVVYAQQPQTKPSSVPAMSQLQKDIILRNTNTNTNTIPSDNFRILDERDWQKKILDQENQNNPAAVMVDEDGNFVLDENGNPVVITAPDKASFLDEIKNHPLTEAGTYFIIVDSVHVFFRAGSMVRKGVPFLQAVRVLGGQSFTITFLKGVKDWALVPVDFMKRRFIPPSYVPAAHTVKNAIPTTARVISRSPSALPSVVPKSSAALTGIKGIAGGTVVTAGGMVVCHYTEKYCDLWRMELDQFQLNDLGDQLLSRRNNLLECKDALEDPSVSAIARRIICPIGYSSLNAVNRDILDYNNKLAIVNAKEKILLDAQVPRPQPKIVPPAGSIGGRMRWYWKNLLR